MNTDAFTVLSDILNKWIPVLIVGIPAMYIWRGQREKSKSDTTVAQLQTHTAEMTAHLQSQGAAIVEKSKIDNAYIQELSKRLDRFEDRAAKNEERWQARYDALEKELDTAKAERGAIILKLAEANAEIKFLTAKLAQSEAASLEKDLQYKQLMTQNEVIMKQRDDYQAQLEAAKSRITALELEVARLGGKL